MTLPPGQQRIEGFPRFGTHFGRPAPAVSAAPEIEITGAVGCPVAIPLTELMTLPRVERTTDFHCVAGWSSTGLHWGGVAFATAYKELIEPLVQPDVTITHLGFAGLDGYRSIVTLEDALGEDVLIADHLDGAPLDADHGAPVRVVSPSQYGFVSTKHLCHIELHTREPRDGYHRSFHIDRGLRLVKPHPRARVWQEERHRYLPAWSLRGVYRLLIPPIKSASARGSPRRRP